jgi:serine protease Do
MNNFFNNDDDNNNTNNVNNNFSDAPDKTSQTPIIIADAANDNGKPNPPAKKTKQRKGITRGFISMAVIVCILFSGFAGFGGTYLARQALNKPAASQTDPLVTVSSDTSSVNQEAVIHKSTATAESTAAIDSNTIASVAAKTANSVVAITTETMQKDSIYGQYVTGGAGSGIIITENGYIITCAHVITGASSIKVKTADGTQYTATVVGSDSLTDIAVIKIDKTGLSYATIGDSSILVVGQPAVAIGNPLGELGGTVTNGIISALDRSVEIDGQSYNLLQTNAAINPGNSGGALFNLNAELIGVVNAKSSGSGIEGLGFAIPINDAIKVAEQLINFGYIKGRPQLGIYVLDVSANTDPFALRSKDYAAIINYITDYGVYFLSYNTQVQTAGDLKFGDRIVAMDGVTVSNKAAIAKLLNEDHKVGDTVKITVARLTDTKTQRSEMIDIKLTLIEGVPETPADTTTPETTTAQ